MTKWRDLFAAFTDDVDERFDALTDRLRTRLGPDPIHILPYHGYGTPTAFYLRGRILEDEGLRPAEDNDKMWENLTAMYRRFESDEIAGARVQLQFQEMTIEAVTDDEGYFDIELRLAAPLASTTIAQNVWHEVALTLLDGAPTQQGPVTAMGQVMVPPPHSDFGIISDMDDTVLQTHATDLLKMAQVTFLNNARTRLPFPGVAAFYQALQGGPSGTAHNPLFYVSSSPWNLYDLLVDFMELQGIPTGPLFLRDFGFGQETVSASGHHGHKLAQIGRLLTTYPDLPFILIGDSGQEDPEIYRAAVHQFPGRIAAIYIRDVSLDARDTEVDTIIQEMGQNDVAMVRVADTVAAAEHAIERGFIEADSLDAIRANKRQDKSAGRNPQKTARMRVDKRVEIVRIISLSIWIKSGGSDVKSAKCVIKCCGRKNLCGAI